jgi:hypothetical protein
MEPAPSATDEPQFAGEPAAAATTEDATFAPDPLGYEEMELVYDTTEPSRPASTGAEHADLIAVPRYVLYLQGGLIGLVALLAFAIGMLTGGAILTQPPQVPAGPQACLITGSVTYSSGVRNLPDEGAVIAVLPQSQARLEEKAPVQGLRPGDPTPDEAHSGISILREAGGAYARADANGRFELRLPDGGRYLVLVISNQKQLRSLDEIKTADILKIGPYFSNAADLVGNRRYQLTMEQVRGDRTIDVAFE